MDDIRLKIKECRYTKEDVETAIQILDDRLDFTKMWDGLGRSGQSNSELMASLKTERDKYARMLGGWKLAESWSEKEDKGDRDLDLL